MNKKGFTLVEVMVVVVIIAILATFGFASLSSGGAKLRSAVRELSSNFHALKAEAVKRNEMATIQFESDGSGYTMYMEDGGGVDWALDGVDTTLSVVTMSDSVEIDQDTFGGVFAYSPLGLTHPDKDPPSHYSATYYEVRLKYANSDSTKVKYLGVRLSVVGTPSVITSTDGTTWVSQ